MLNSRGSPKPTNYGPHQVALGRSRLGEHVPRPSRRRAGDRIPPSGFRHLPCGLLHASHWGGDALQLGINGRYRRLPNPSFNDSRPSASSAGDTVSGASIRQSQFRSGPVRTSATAISSPMTDSRTSAVTRNSRPSVSPAEARPSSPARRADTTKLRTSTPGKLKLLLH